MISISLRSTFYSSFWSGCKAVIRRSRRLSVSLSFICLFYSTVAWSHPHSWIDMKTEIVGSEGHITGLNMTWTFDDMTSLYLLDDEDMSEENRLTTLQNLADGMVENMSRVAYMTYFTDAAQQRYVFSSAKNAMLKQQGLKLAFSFYIPFATPVAFSDALMLRVFDDSHYTDMSWLKPEDVQLSSALQNQCALNMLASNATAEQTAYAMSLSATATAEKGLGALFTQRVMIECQTPVESAPLQLGKSEGK